MVVIGGFVFYMFHLGTHKALGVFIPYIAEELELTEHLVGLSCGIGVGLRTIPGGWRSLFPYVNIYKIR